MLPETLEDHTHYILLSGIELFMDGIKFLISSFLFNDKNIFKHIQNYKDKLVKTHTSSVKF